MRGIKDQLDRKLQSISNLIREMGKGRGRGSNHRRWEEGKEEMGDMIEERGK